MPPRQYASGATAIPSPPPMHSVTMPRRRPSRRIPCSRRVTSTAPVAATDGHARWLRNQTALARGLSAAGLHVGLAERDAAKLAPLAAETGALAFAADASDLTSVARLVAEVDAQLGEPDIVIYNASARAQGPLAELNPRPSGRRWPSPPSVASWSCSRQPGACCRIVAAPSC
jgi:hypothetical protein